jgi:hypothetical protein
MTKNSGADMQPEFDAQTSAAPAVNYFPVRSGGQVQDDLRRAADEGAAPTSRQTLGDPEDYSNAASGRTANTPVKPRSAPPPEGT